MECHDLGDGTPDHSICVPAIWTGGAVDWWPKAMPPLCQYLSSLQIKSAYGQMRPDPGAVEQLRRRGVEVDGPADGRGCPSLRRARPPPHGGRTSPDLLMDEFALESSAFENAQAIPSRHSCPLRTGTHHQRLRPTVSSKSAWTITA